MTPETSGKCVEKFETCTGYTYNTFQIKSNDSCYDCVYFKFSKAALWHGQSFTNPRIILEEREGGAIDG